MKIFVFILTTVFSINLIAQNSSKKVLSISDFASWKTIANPQISNNGRFVAFELNPQRGDGKLILKHGNQSDTIPRGNKLLFGSENTFAVFHIKQP